MWIAKRPISASATPPPPARHDRTPLFADAGRRIYEGHRRAIRAPGPPLGRGAAPHAPITPSTLGDVDPRPQVPLGGWTGLAGLPKGAAGAAPRWAPERSANCLSLEPARPRTGSAARRQGVLPWTRPTLGCWPAGPLSDVLPRHDVSRRIDVSAPVAPRGAVPRGPGCHAQP